MDLVLWILAIEGAVAVVVLGWFGLQVGLLNARIMHAVMGQQGKLLDLAARQGELIATIRVGDGQAAVARPAPDPYDGAWVPEDRPVGSS